MKGKYVLLGLLVLVLVALGLWVYGHLEAYCVFYPAIDTKFAPGYSEAAFEKVTPRMDTPNLERLVGKPLSVITNRDGSETWWFTSDGKCWWGDFAWLGRSVVISNGIVIAVERKIYYD